MTTTDDGRGSVTVIGTGIRSTGQFTVESIAAIRRADILVHLANDSIGEAILASMKPGHERSLRPLYRVGAPRRSIYREMVEAALEPARAGAVVCAAFYGHPGVFARPPHDIVETARAEGIAAAMLPAVSAEDCLIADLGIDPGRSGCCSHEATDFLLYERPFSPCSHLLLWQVDALGDWTHQRKHSTKAVPLLVDKLATRYPREHMVTAYAAPTVVGARPTIERMQLNEMAEFDWRPSHTLYVPPSEPARADEKFTASFRALE